MNEGTKSIADDLRRAVLEAAPILAAIDDEASARPPAPGKWCPRELIGHLIDSASNNHQRFVRARFQDDLVFPGYQQDEWVAAQRYRDAPWRELIELWRSFNLHLAHVIDCIPAEVRTRPRRRHNLDAIAFKTVDAAQTTTLEYFLRDYVDHLRHHLASLEC